MELTMLTALIPVSIPIKPAALVTATVPVTPTYPPLLTTGLTTNTERLPVSTLVELTTPEIANGGIVELNPVIAVLPGVEVKEPDTANGAILESKPVMAVFPGVAVKLPLTANTGFTTSTLRLPVSTILAENAPETGSGGRVGEKPVSAIEDEEDALPKLPVTKTGELKGIVTDGVPTMETDWLPVSVTTGAPVIATELTCTVPPILPVTCVRIIPVTLSGIVFPPCTVPENGIGAELVTWTARTPVSMPMMPLGAETIPEIANIGFVRAKLPPATLIDPPVTATDWMLKLAPVKLMVLFATSAVVKILQFPVIG